MMQDHLTLTKSKTSRISRSQTKSPIKKGRSFDLKSRRIPDVPETPPSQKRESVQLEVTHHHIPADSTLLFSDVLAGINYLVGIQFPPFPQRGLGRDRIAELYSARKAIPPIAVTSQLHSVFTSHTQIERELSDLISSGIVRRIVLREGSQTTSTPVNFGMILSTTYTSLLSSYEDICSSFKEWVEGPGRTAVFVSGEELTRAGVSSEDIQRLFELGFLTMEYSLGELGYTISVPGIGNFIRNLRGGRRELLRVLKRQTYHEILEKNLMARKTKESILSYSFHLHELVGSGRFEVFMTPAGRGIKITSKGLAEVK